MTMINLSDDLLYRNLNYAEPGNKWEKKKRERVIWMLLLISDSLTLNPTKAKAPDAKQPPLFCWIASTPALYDSGRLWEEFIRL